MKKNQKTFDAVAFMRKRREELSRAYAGLSVDEIEERIQKSLKDDPLWKQRSEIRPASASRKRSHDCQ